MIVCNLGFADMNVCCLSTMFVASANIHISKAQDANNHILIGPTFGAPNCKIGGPISFKFIHSAASVDRLSIWCTDCSHREFTPIEY